MDQDIKSNIIIIIPGTIASPLLKKDDPEPIWRTQVLRRMSISPKDAAKMMEQTLYAGKPDWPHSHSPYKQLADKIQKFAATKGLKYNTISTKWPTEKPTSVGPKDKFDWFFKGQSITGNTIIFWSYDWRQDNLVTAMMLRNFLYNLTNGREIGTISLIGHSMGGLVARAYIESVGKDDPILQKIDQLITLGTPHLGAANALGPISDTPTKLAESDPFPIMELREDEEPDDDDLDNALPGKVQEFIHRFVNGPVGTSTYQLIPTWTLPNADVRDFIKFGHDFYPLVPLHQLPPGLQALLDRTNINAASIAAAGKLFESLDYVRNGTPAIQYNCLYSDKIDTVTGFEFDGQKLSPILTKKGGDGTVSTDSAKFKDSAKKVQRISVGRVKHVAMPRDSGVQDTVNKLLFSSR